MRKKTEKRGTKELHVMNNERQLVLCPFVSSSEYEWSLIPWDDFTFYLLCSTHTQIQSSLALPFSHPFSHVLSHLHFAYFSCEIPYNTFVCNENGATPKISDCLMKYQVVRTLRNKQRTLWPRVYRFWKPYCKIVTGDLSFWLLNLMNSKMNFSRRKGTTSIKAFTF